VTKHAPLVARAVFGQVELAAELGAEQLTELRRRAAVAGLAPQEIERALDAAQPKRALVALLVEAAGYHQHHGALSGAAVGSAGGVHPCLRGCCFRGHPSSPSSALRQAVCRGELDGLAASGWA
jgi:hypothetical protein